MWGTFTAMWDAITFPVGHDCGLRMRPDRIIVGEIRGEEALDMLQAMNTGHDGSLTAAGLQRCHLVSRAPADLPIPPIWFFSVDGAMGTANCR
jgi:hypothetical protein